METPLKRIYVGGIGPSVTKTELTDRFGKFGKVDDVEIISRKDEQGNPIKTFAYININISDADVKKCMSVLNKTKWKGGVLQIEMAKESFLHRLSQERQDVKDREKTKAQRNSQRDLVQSLEKAGVTDFHMKAAVPGTEVPNHKNWVVSKFGRVLPVLQLHGTQQSKNMKYDPSKFCHNIKKLDDSSFEPVPVSKLTWEVEGGDDEISRKRKGEFPDFKSPLKKKHTNLDKRDAGNAKTSTKALSHSIAEGKSENKNTRKPLQIKNHGYLLNKSINSMSDDEYDSEQELQAVLEREKARTSSVNNSEDSNVEVVDDSFELSYTAHWAKQKATTNSSLRDDDEYDSADTDEIITVAKTTQNNCESDKKKKDKIVRNNASVKMPLNKQGSTDVLGAKNRLQSMNTVPDSDSDSEASAAATDSSDSFSDEEYEGMMQNCYRLDLTMGDLEALSKEAEECESDYMDDDTKYECQLDSADTINVRYAKSAKQDDSKLAKTSDVISRPDMLPDPKKKQNNKSVTKVVKKKQEAKNTDSRKLASLNDEKESESSDAEENACGVNGELKRLKAKSIAAFSLVNNHEQDHLRVSENTEHNKKKGTGSEQIRKVKRGIEPDDIVASILEDYDSGAEQPKQKRKKGPLVTPPAFKGLGSLLASLSSPSSLSTTFCCQTAAVSKISNEISSNSQTNKGRKKQTQQLCKDLKNVPEAKLADSSSSDMSSNDSSSDSSSIISAAGKCVTPSINTKAQPTSKIKQQQDNQKRLTAMEERRKERELQKQTIQGALLKLDSQGSKKSQHVVFSSESETENEKEEETSTSETKLLLTDKKIKQGASKLFDSDEEDSDNEDGKDNERFEIKAQYEGRSGEKLMQMQSRFGMDERFKMDSRFLESSSDEDETSEAQNELSAEKKKNMDILQSILNINVEPQPASKQAVKAKKFKDLNALHYDPTKEDHAEFETKAEEKKESKSERKKKRLEAEKLPEVSKETYHEVIVDFKEVFGASKPQSTEEPQTTWDQQMEPEKMEDKSDMSSEIFSFQHKKMEEPEGFTFSFFGNSVDESVPNNETYKVETINPAKVAWQEDPRFQDSSSEGEDDEDNDTAIVQDNTISHSTQPVTSGIRFFFFVKDDERLKMGPRMFCRSSNTEQANWEQRRDILLEECRKRHKDAKRKMKAKH